MDRADLQQIAGLRITEAKVLLDNACYAGAYYLAGYAVECALKACIAKQTRRYEFPDKQRVGDSYTHDLTKLVRIAGLKDVLEQEIESDQALFANWDIVKEWSEGTRYQTDVSERRSRELYSAITGRKNGVLAWIRQWW